MATGTNFTTDAGLCHAGPRVSSSASPGARTGPSGSGPPRLHRTRPPAVPQPRRPTLADAARSQEPTDPGRPKGSLPGAGRSSSLFEMDFYHHRDSRGTHHGSRTGPSLRYPTHVRSTVGANTPAGLSILTVPTRSLTRVRGPPTTFRVAPVPPGVLRGPGPKGGTGSRVTPVTVRCRPASRPTETGASPRAEAVAVTRGDRAGPRAVFTPTGPVEGRRDSHRVPTVPDSDRDTLVRPPSAHTTIDDTRRVRPRGPRVPSTIDVPTTGVITWFRSSPSRPTGPVGGPSSSRRRPTPSVSPSLGSPVTPTSTPAALPETRTSTPIGPSAGGREGTRPKGRRPADRRWGVRTSSFLPWSEP